MEGKKKLKVNFSASNKIWGWQGFYSLFGWVFLIGGIFTTIGGIIYAVDEDDPTVVIIGASILVVAFVFLFNSTLLRGMGRIVECAEYKKAIIEDEYDVMEKD